MIKMYCLCSSNIVSSSYTYWASLLSEDCCSALKNHLFYLPLTQLNTPDSLYSFTRLRACQPHQKFSYQTLLVISDPRGRLALWSISEHFWTVFVMHSLFSNCLSDTCPISCLPHQLPNQKATYTPRCFGPQRVRTPSALVDSEEETWIFSLISLQRGLSLQAKAPYVSINS